MIGRKNIIQRRKKEEDGEADVLRLNERKTIPSFDDFELPEFVRRAENEQLLQMYIRMRQRHLADGAVNLNLEQDDVADQNFELYENKGINLERPVLNDKTAKNVDYYIESISRDKFYKVSQIKHEMLEGERAPTLPTEKKIQRRPSDFKQAKPDHKGIGYEPIQRSRIDLGRFTEDELFAEFDEKLNEVINKTMSKVSLIFLFIQGLLAGISLVNILLLLEYTNFSSFINVYSNDSREIFNFTHAFTFGALVGNGIKFVSNYQKFKIAKSRLIFNKTTVAIKRSMLFSATILFLLIVMFAIELYLTTYIPIIFYLRFTTQLSMSATSFQLFSTLYIVCNFIGIICFIFNIFDANIKIESNLNLPVEMVDSNETRESTLVEY